ncbi:hypothetical protein [Streptomyces sp. NBC_01518]|uniref:hypothetical protein n=1 Tax=Streptomyces sp. NBC_01518 TaxID=2903891 RepID=UPI00386BDF51
MKSQPAPLWAAERDAAAGAAGLRWRLNALVSDYWTPARHAVDHEDAETLGPLPVTRYSAARSCGRTACFEDVSPAVLLTADPERARSFVRDFAPTAS